MLLIGSFNTERRGEEKRRCGSVGNFRFYITSLSLCLHQMKMSKRKRPFGLTARSYRTFSRHIASLFLGEGNTIHKLRMQLWQRFFFILGPCHGLLPLKTRGPQLHV